MASYPNSINPKTLNPELFAKLAAALPLIKGESDKTFAMSLHDQYNKQGGWSVKQALWAEKMADKAVKNAQPLLHKSVLQQVTDDIINSQAYGHGSAGLTGPGKGPWSGITQAVDHAYGKDMTAVGMVTKQGVHDSIIFSPLSEQKLAAALGGVSLAAAAATHSMQGASAAMNNLAVMLTNAKQHLKEPAILLHVPSGGSDGIPKKIKIKKAKIGDGYNVVGVSPGPKYWYGTILSDGVFVPKGAKMFSTEAVAHAIQQFMEQPAAKAAEYGKLHGKCCFCNKDLTDKMSIKVGYGPVCAQHYGLPYGANVKPKGLVNTGGLLNSIKLSPGGSVNIKILPDGNKHHVQPQHHWSHKPDPYLEVGDKVMVSGQPCIVTKAGPAPQMVNHQFYFSADSAKWAPEGTHLAQNALYVKSQKAFLPQDIVKPKVPVFKNLADMPEMAAEMKQEDAVLIDVKANKALFEQLSKPVEVLF